MTRALQEQQTKEELQEQLQFNNLETVVEIDESIAHEFVTYAAEETDGCDEMEVSYFQNVQQFHCLNPDRITMSQSEVSEPVPVSKSRDISTDVWIN